MKKVFCLFFIPLITIVTGCSMTKEQIQSSKPVDKSLGIVLAAVTTVKVKYIEDANYYLRETGTKEEQRIDAFEGSIFGKHDDYPEDKSRDGSLIALPLKTGSYELCNWGLYIATGVSFTDIHPAKPPVPLKFTISPGEITYIGDLHIDPLMGKNLLGISIPGGGNPGISDNSAVDLQLLRKKYPNLQDWPVRTNILDGKAWSIIH